MMYSVGLEIHFTFIQFIIFIPVFYVVNICLTIELCFYCVNGNLFKLFFNLWIVNFCVNKTVNDLRWNFIYLYYLFRLNSKINIFLYISRINAKIPLKEFYRNRKRYLESYKKLFKIHINFRIFFNNLKCYFRYLIIKYLPKSILFS